MLWQRPIVYLFTRQGLKCTCIRITLPQTLKMPPNCDIVAVSKSTCTHIVQLKIRAMAFGFSLKASSAATSRVLSCYSEIDRFDVFCLPKCVKR